MLLKTEYKKTPCLYCEKQKLRTKLQGDWQQGEKLTKGYHPETFDYWYCDNCKRTCLTFKNENMP